MSRGAADSGRAFRLRAWFVFGVLMLGAGGLMAKALRLQLVDRPFLIKQGDARIMRNVVTGANRGAIVDRNGSLLAISTPVVSIAADPQELGEFPDRWPELATALGRNRDEIARLITRNRDKEFLWLARQLSPADGEVIRKLNIPGVQFIREQKRFYPAGEVVAQIVGFTNVDEVGQEGAELFFDSILAGEPGRKRVYQDRDGRHVEPIENIQTARPGQELSLSIDMRIQSLAHKALKTAFAATHARAGWVVVIDVTTGEIIAMANQPTFNPNARSKLNPALYTNRAVTDILEPGSSIKPFVIAAALSSGRFNASSRIDVSQGFVRVGNRVIKDEHPQGVLDLAGVLAKSSNAAMAEISQRLEPKQIWDTLKQMGFGSVTASEFRGESEGILSNYGSWKVEQIASISYGYGISVTPLQLAQGYAAIGSLGVMRPLTMQRRLEEVPGARVLDEQVARQLIGLMESVVRDGGTGTKAAIPGYRVAGKTGTALKTNGAGGYFDDRYFAIFGGVAPASNPRLAAVVVIDEPSAGIYYGGDVSAPVFAKVMGDALRLLGVAPDAAAGPSDPATGVSTVVQR